MFLCDSDVTTSVTSYTRDDIYIYDTSGGMTSSDILRHDVIRYDDMTPHARYDMTSADVWRHQTCDGMTSSDILRYDVIRQVMLWRHQTCDGMTSSDTWCYDVIRHVTVWCHQTRMTSSDMWRYDVIRHVTFMAQMIARWGQKTLKVFTTKLHSVNSCVKKWGGFLSDYIHISNPILTE